MAHWPTIARELNKHVVQISSPAGSGTGFLLLRGPDASIVVVTAAHVIDFTHKWSLPLTIFNRNNGKHVVLEKHERAIQIDEDADTASIYFYDDGELELPEAPLRRA